MKEVYDVHFQKVASGGWHQIFKYIVKTVGNEKITFNVFKDLYRALKGVRAFQGFGCFHGLKFPEEIDESNDPEYDGLIKQLVAMGAPTECAETPVQVREHILRGKWIYISRRSVRAYVKRNGLDEGAEFKLVIPGLPFDGVQQAMPLPPPDYDYWHALEGGRSVRPKRRNESGAFVPVAETVASAVVTAGGETLLADPGGFEDVF
jgi:hypothetical protein